MLLQTQSPDHKTFGVKFYRIFLWSEGTFFCFLLHARQFGEEIETTVNFQLKKETIFKKIILYRNLQCGTKQKPVTLLVYTLAV